jgi:hypothetical protein
MKTPWVLLIVLAIIGFIIIGVFFFLFRAGTSLISSFDGNNAKSNYQHVVKDYYLFNAEQSVCLYLGDRYERVTANVDSLSWNDEEIVGYSKGKYFRISIDKKQIEYYKLKDSLFLFVPIIPSQKFSSVPALK